MDADGTFGNAGQQQQIISLLADLNRRLADRRVTVTLDKKAKDWVAEKGYDPVFGARPLKRFLQRNIETKLARALISGEIGDGSEIKFSVKSDELVMANAPEPQPAAKR